MAREDDGRTVSFFMRAKPLARRLKTFLVASDRPGSGWSGTVRAFTRARAIACAKWRFGGDPDTVYEVPADFEKTQAESREREIYEGLDSDDFLVALGLTGMLPKVREDFPNERMLEAMAGRLELLMKDKGRVSRVEGLLNRSQFNLQ